MMLAFISYSPHRVLIACALLCTSGCASHVATMDHYELTLDELRAYRAVQIAPPFSENDSQYQPLGPVSGLSCSNHAGSVDEREAVDQLKLKASLMGADLISTPGCGKSAGVDWSNNCWQSLLCEAVALKRRETSAQSH